MASPAQLVETVSRATGLPLPTVTDIDRRLVTGGLRTKGGRGFHAARMTPLDAANLLTAVLASPLSNTAVEAVNRYARTTVDRARSSDRLFATAELLDDLAALPRQHSFVAALAALLASAASGALARLTAAAADTAGPGIEVFAFTRATRGSIRITGLPNGLTASLEYGPAAAAADGIATAKAPMSARGLTGPDAGTGDLEQSRRLTERTILAVARLLAEEENHAGG